MTDPQELAQPHEVVEGYGQKYIVDPNGNKEWIVNSGGFTKEEVVMKDFMAAIINAFSGTKKGANALLEMRGKHNIEPDIIVAKMAKEYTAAYFKELNKKDK